MKEPLYQRLMARHPLKAKAKTKAGSDLAKLAKAYADIAAYNGDKGPWWRVWRAVERARGHKLRDSIATLEPSARRWFALWSFHRNRTREGVVIYRAYLAEPGDIGPFDRENAIYLKHLAANANGDAESVVREADAMLAKTNGAANVEAVVLQALVTAGDASVLAKRYPAPDANHVHDGAAWGRYAIACVKTGDRKRADAALAMCAKLGVKERKDDTLEKMLLTAFELSAERWAELCAPWGYPKDDYQAKWRKSPGLQIEPTKSSPHAFGGDEFSMPSCPGCGHRMHAFFVFDVAAVDDLRACIPSWPKLPLVACLDCALWLVRRDFKVDHEARSLRVLGVFATAATLASFGKTHGTIAPIRRQPVALVPVPQDEDPPNDRTQVGGEPDWVQDFERAFCPECHEPMPFVAAFGSTWKQKLEPEISVNNGSGYQYHFACDGCAVLSVFGQNT